MMSFKEDNLDYGGAFIKTPDHSVIVSVHCDKF